MGLGGLRHDASWNVVYRGLLHGVALAAWRFSPLPMVPSSTAGRALGWAVTTGVVFTGWFLFRATAPAVLMAMVGALGNSQWVPVHGSPALARVCVCMPFALCEHGLRHHGDFAVLALRDRQLGLPATNVVDSPTTLATPWFSSETHLSRWGRQNFTEGFAAVLAPHFRIDAAPRP